MNLWYFFGGFLLLIFVANPLLSACEALPQKAQNAIALVIFTPVLALMVWAVWFMFTGQVDPSFNNDYIKR
ncbi:hypothetical protein DKY63_29605 [Pseudomonas putida]|uniref:Uncharacterized protein n=1 Tax=Pseudomonas putida TaxID=303 RepID=A0A2Z4RS55_PSEPU|nr:hypothetical protein DKY63_29605 [Pseudomonas putida]